MVAAKIGLPHRRDPVTDGPVLCLLAVASNAAPLTIEFTVIEFFLPQLECSIFAPIALDSVRFSAADECSCWNVRSDSSRQCSIGTILIVLCV